MPYRIDMTKVRANASGSRIITDYLRI